MHKETVATRTRPTDTKNKKSAASLKPSEKRKATEMDQQEKVASQSKQVSTVKTEAQKLNKRRT